MMHLLSASCRGLALSSRSLTSPEGLPQSQQPRASVASRASIRSQLPPSEHTRDDQPKASGARNVAVSVRDDPVWTAGAVAACIGSAAIVVLVGNQVADQLEAVPLVPAALQVVGVTYTCWLAGQLIKNNNLLLPPAAKEQPWQEDVDDGTAAALWKLALESDGAVPQIESMLDAAQDLTRVSAEKEALEAVAIQLAEERDEAVSEVVALKAAVDGMTTRMRKIEAMLESEVSELKLQNQALETVAMQLATERDRAMTHVRDLTEDNGLLKKERAELVVIIKQLSEERDQARREAEELRQVMASFQTKSGGPSEGGAPILQFQDPRDFYEHHQAVSSMQPIEVTAHDNHRVRVSGKSKKRERANA